LTASPPDVDRIVSRTEQAASAMQGEILLHVVVGGLSLLPCLAMHFVEIGTLFGTFHESMRFYPIASTAIHEF
jgi:hypothetical protein